MATVISSPTYVPLPASQRPVTVEDLASLPEQLATGPVKYELENGRLIIMPPPGAEHGSSQVRIGAELLIQGERQGYGRAFTDVGVVLWRNPDTCYGPDAAFISKAALPIRLSREGYLETIPDIVAEVRSKNDTTPEILTKVGNYHKVGVKLVWILDSEKRTVTVYPNGEPSQTLDAAATLTADAIIPGFQVLVGSLFA